MTPAFPADTDTYKALVANRTDAVKLTATKHHDSATVAITNDDDPATPGEAELDLRVGSNALTVTVTAEDADITLTYTVTVERYTADILVSNTHLGATGGNSSSFLAQSFETGANLDGYTISEVDIRLGTVSGRSTSVRIRENDGGEPGDLVATLTNPGTLTEDSLNTFTAPSGTTLDASTTYWITTNEGISSSSQRAEFARDLSDDELAEPGWSIGDGYRFRTSETGSWRTSFASLLIEIRGIGGKILPAPRLPAVDDPQAIWLATLTVANLGSGQYGYDDAQCGRGGLTDTAFTYLGDNTPISQSQNFTKEGTLYTIDGVSYLGGVFHLSLDQRFTQSSAANIVVDVDGTPLLFSNASYAAAPYFTYTWTAPGPLWSVGDEVPLKIVVLQDADGPEGLAATTTLSVHTTQTGRKYETRDLTLTWRAPTGGGTVTGYRVEYQPDPAFQWKTLVASQSGTTYTQGGKLRSVVDYYRVAALRSGEPASYSGLVRVQVPPETRKVPQSVGYLEAGPAPCSAVKAAWNRAYTRAATGVGGGVRATGYQVQYAPDDGRYPHYVIDGEDWSTVTLPRWLDGLKWEAWSGSIEEIDSLERRKRSPDLKTVITGLEPGTKYRVRVRGCSDARCGEWIIPKLVKAGRATANAVEAEPLTASFASAPEAHDGESGFQVRIAFSDDVEITPEDMRDHALLVSGGTVTDAAGVDGRKDLWELTVEPSGTGPVSILAPQDRACTETGALCTADGRSLTASPALEVPGPPAQQANSPATGAPSISGTAQVGETLTADTSGIADDDGLANVTYGYQWVAYDGTTDTDIPDATDAAYTLVADDAARTVKVRVTFNDDAGNPEALTSAATDEVDFAVQQQGASNNPATGAPTISGAVQVGETLTADTSGIEDADGLDNAAFRYQWLADAADITGATDSTYSLVAADAGKTIKVRVGFTDDRGNPESRTSAATNPVEAAPEPPAKPTGLSATVVSHDAVTLAWDDPQDDAVTGYVILRRDKEIHPMHTFVTIAGDTGSADTTYTDATVEPEKKYNYKIKAINEHGEVSERSHGARANTPAAPPTDSLATGEPTITGTAQVSRTLTADTSGIADEDGLNNAVFAYQWLSDDAEITDATGSTYTLFDDNEGRTIKVRVTVTDDLGNETTLTSAATEAVAAAPQPDSPATGEPTISGTAQVGRTLSVDTSGIADDNGLDSAVFAYQWLSDDAGIVGATGSTYTLVDEDQGNTIKVRVSFTDDLGNETTLTSAATEAVAAAPQPDSPATGEPTITGTAQVGRTLTADTSGIADADGLDNAVFAYQWLSDDAEIVGATGSTYTLVDEDQGNTIKVRVTVTDDLGNETTLTSAATEAVEAKRNTAATGRPTISGTAQVGQTLTADTSDIEDADGLTNVSYRYQWVVTDGGAYINISGEKGATYTLVSADRGLRILVRVTFTDDAGKRERLTSAETDRVAAAP